MSNPPDKPPTLKPGGSEGGEGLFFLGGGLALLGIGLYLLLDSVRVVSGDFGALSGMFHRRGMGQTTSMGIIFIPFLIGAAILFYDAAKKWAWWLAGAGLLAIIIEIFSRISFVMNMKTTHLLLILIMIAAGAGLLAKAYQTQRHK
ncbi:MAG: hypothetical protein AAGC74_08025 [Verrucomicrobiota bacterium]